MTRMTGGRALVEMLCRHGIDTLFALPGVQNDALFVALYDSGEAIRVIHPRHEQAAAYMAFGYARASGKVGAYAVVPGPGVLNTTAALATAYATNAPVLCISGQIPSNLIGRGFGLLHEVPDQLAILRGLTKWAARIDHPSETGKRVNEAFRQLADGRPRPVALEMPLDIMALETEVELPAVEPTLPAPVPDGELIGQAAKLLAAAKQPLIYIGSGAADAGAEVLALAERLHAPLTTYTGGKGVVSDRHYLAQNLPPMSSSRLARASTSRRRVGGSMPRSRSSASTSIRSRSPGSPARRSASLPTPRRRSPRSTRRSPRLSARRASASWRS